MKNNKEYIKAEDRRSPNGGKDKGGVASLTEGKRDTIFINLHSDCFNPCFDLPLYIIHSDTKDKRIHQKH